MADQNERSGLVQMEIRNREFLRLLITNLISKFRNTNGGSNMVDRNEITILSLFTYSICDKKLKS